MTIDGVNTMAHGLVPIKVTGAYDMPARKGAWFYDWGDSYEALFGPNYTAWQPRIVVVDFLYDSRYQTIGTPGEDYIETYAQNELSVGEKTLVLTNAVSALGAMTVSVQSITKHKTYLGGKAKVTITFSEINPVFSGALPGTKSASGITIDGYGLKQFEVTVVRTGGIAGVGSALDSQVTTRLLNPKKRTIRAPHSFYLECFIVNSNPLVQMYNLQKVLSQEKVLPFVLGNYSFDVVCVNGFSAQSRGKGALKFNLQLTRI